MNCKLSVSAIVLSLVLDLSGAYSPCVIAAGRDVSPEVFVSQYRASSASANAERMKNARIVGKIVAFDCSGEAEIRLLDSTFCRVCNPIPQQSRSERRPKKQTVARFGPDFSFRLERDDDAQSYQVVSITREGTTGEEGRRRVEAEISARGGELVMAPVSICSKGMLELLAGAEGFEIQKVTDEFPDEECVTVDFSLKSTNKNASLSGHVELLKNLGFAIRKYELSEVVSTAPSAGSELGEHYNNTTTALLDYQSLEARQRQYPDIVTIKQSSSLSKSVSTATFSTTAATFGDVKVEELRLSAFGLPDTLTDRKSSGIWYLGILVALGLVCGLYFMIRSKSL